MFNKNKTERIIKIRILLKDDDDLIDYDVKDILLTNGFVVLFMMDGTRNYLNQDRVECIECVEVNQ